MLRILTIVLTGVAAPLATFGQAGSRPNVLLITSEDNGPHLSCYGDANVETPNLDHLAAEGVRFERVYVATASCSESRSAIFTGLFPHQNGQIGLATHRYRMYQEFPVLPGRLADAGYRTGVIGKIHVNPPAAFEGFAHVRPKGMKVVNSFGARNVRSVAEAASWFMRQDDPRPFFLMVNYSDAHLPFLRQQFGLPEEPLEPDSIEVLPSIGIDTQRIRRHVADYYNCLKRLDDGIGMLMAALEASGRADDTLVIYLGDHGAQFSRGKATCYESGLRVPMLVRWPGHTAEGLVRRELAMTVDILPTVLEAAGVQSPGDHLAGRSLVPLFDEGSRPWRQSMFAEYHGAFPAVYFPQRVVRDDRYKLIVNLLQDRPNAVEQYYTLQRICPTGASAEEITAAPETSRRAYATWREAPPEELYDLEKDPYELNNLSGDHRYADVLDRLRAELLRWQKETNDPLLDPANLARLTEEHDALGDKWDMSYRRDPQFGWRYTEYLWSGEG